MSSERTVVWICMTPVLVFLAVVAVARELSGFCWALGRAA